MLGWEFPPRISGGLGTACLGLTRGLAALGVPVVFVLPRRSGDEADGPARIVGCDDAPSMEASVGAPVAMRAVSSSLVPYESRDAFRRRSVEAGRPPPATEDVAAAPPAAAPPAPQELPDEVARYARAVERIAAGEEYDIVHGHDWMTYPAAAAAARLRGVPLVLHVHSSEIDRSGPRADPMLCAIEQRGLDDADAVICVSAYTARRLATHYRVDPAKVHVVHNAALLDGESPPPRPRHLPEPVVLFLGRVTFQKGPAFFLEAAARVAAEHRTVRFVVAGGGDLLHPMIERAATLGLARRVHFTGFLGREDVERAFAAADVYVMPSVSEPFGIAALEAMARGVPVVLSKQSGAAEILRSPVMVDFWDTAETARRILELLRRPALRARLAREGREEAGRLRWEGQAATVKALYETLVA
jgi:glycosyltransferase involved in cell wall biosynthesis